METDVNQAINAGYPAGLILKGQIFDVEHDKELRIAFDFDGVIADDASETVMQYGTVTRAAVIVFQHLVCVRKSVR